MPWTEERPLGRGLEVVGASVVVCPKLDEAKLGDVSAELAVDVTWTSVAVAEVVTKHTLIEHVPTIETVAATDFDRL